MQRWYILTVRYQMGNIKLMNLILNNMKKILEFIKKGWAWIATDGLLHFAFSALLILIAFPIIKWWGLLFALLIGVLKEVYDITVKKSDWRISPHDLICDIVGIAYGLANTALFCL